jgi:hypothetical protein
VASNIDGHVSRSTCGPETISHYNAACESSIEYCCAVATALYLRVLASVSHSPLLHLPPIRSMQLYDVAEPQVATYFLSQSLSVLSIVFELTKSHCLQVCEELLTTRSPQGAAVLHSIVSSCSAHLAGLTGSSSSSSSSSSSDASGGGSGWMRGAVEVLGRLCPAVAAYQGAQVQHSDDACTYMKMVTPWVLQRWRGYVQLACAVPVGLSNAAGMDGWVLGGVDWWSREEEGVAVHCYAAACRRQRISGRAFAACACHECMPALTAPASCKCSRAALSVLPRLAINRVSCWRHLPSSVPLGYETKALLPLYRWVLLQLLLSFILSGRLAAMTA